MKRLLSAIFLLAAIAGFAYAFIKIAVVNGPFMIVIGVSSFLTLMSGIMAGLGQGSADLFAAKNKIKELAAQVALLGDANEGVKAQFDAKVAEAVKLFKEGYRAGPNGSRIIVPTPEETQRVANA